MNGLQKAVFSGRLFLVVERREEVIDIVSRECGAKPEIQLCILYGSAAADRLTFTSDIDLAIGSENALSNDCRLELSTACSLKTGREVTVLDIAKLDGIILGEVLSKGIRIKNSNPFFLARFIIKMYEYTEDLLPYKIIGMRKKIEEYLRE